MMIRNLHIIITASFALLLSACAKQPSESELDIPSKPAWNAQSCEFTDWYHMGRTKIKDGIVQININEIAAECAEQGVYIDTASYFYGLNEEARQFCTPEQGRVMGLSGKPYPTLCKPEIYSEFYFEWYRNMQNYCHMQTTSGTGRPEACDQIKQ